MLTFNSPVGHLLLEELDGSLVAINWGTSLNCARTPLLERARAQLMRYFAGERVTFDFPMAPRGTAYSKRVWAALARLPYGSTISYGALARLSGGSARSVGSAMARNPLPIVIPCHRVVGRNGLCGYSGGDALITKRFLLDLEQEGLRRLSEANRDLGN